MYLEFRLSAKDDHSLIRLQIASQLVNRDLHAWSDKYEIPYKTKIHKLTKRVMFDDPETYSFFALTFVPSSYTSSRWSLVEPMSPPKKL
jgi:hypothetical protein